MSSDSSAVGHLGVLALHLSPITIAPLGLKFPPFGGTRHQSDRDEVTRRRGVARLGLTISLSERFGYDTSDIVILTDDAQDPRQIPTRENIMRAMQWLVSGAQKDDALFFH
jgi:hypothetical protein